MQQTGLAADAVVTLHETGPGHPEQTARFHAIMARLEQSGLTEYLTRLPARSATDEELIAVHPAKYIALVEHESAGGAPYLSMGDTALSADSVIAARFAAGSVLSAVDAVFDGAVQNAFCNVRPPGHHASQNRGMGFCLFNNVAVAARYAQKRHGAGRVLIADWDVHHGNGTQDVFYGDPDVLFFSTHQSPWYPGTGAVVEQGEGAGFGTTINCPLPAGSGRVAVFQAFDDLLIPAAMKFMPDIILLSAGFDSRKGDPLGSFILTDEDFGDLTNRMLELAGETCQGRLVSVLEGGYNLQGLASASESHIRALLQLHGSHPSAS